MEFCRKFVTIVPVPNGATVTDAAGKNADYLAVDITSVPHWIRADDNGKIELLQQPITVTRQ